jgi:DNA segregation ATPase FtsK/SpoIIIE-like protein
MVARRRDGAGWLALLAGAAVGVWGWRLELALAAALVASQRLLASLVGDVAAAGVVAVLVGAGLAVGPLRRVSCGGLRAARVRRAWRRAVEDVGLSVDVLRAPRVLNARRIAAGDVLRVRVCRGQSVVTLEARAGELAACLHVREVRVEPERGDAALARVTLVRRDPFDDPAPLTWPDADIQERSLWDPIALGVDEHGEPVRVRLVERNVLVGGEPGAGKSVALSLFVAAAALDPGTRVWLLDGKLVELAAWAPVAERLVGPDGGEAIGLLRDVQREMDARYRELLARGLRKVPRDDELPLHLVVVDELAFYLSLPDRRQRQELTELLRDLVARGRAAGVIVVAATQKPGADVVPSSLRDLFGFRLALRCNTPQASDTILGQGWACTDADASTVPGAQRGVGFLLAEGAQPIRVKTYHLDDDELASIAERASARRADAWLDAGTPVSGQEAVS